MPDSEMEKKVQKIARGVVVSKSGDKSIRVQIDRLTKHPLYKKYLKRRTKLGVHDQDNQAKVGDVVDIVECRPVSKTKSWRLVKVVQESIIE